MRNETPLVELDARHAVDDNEGMDLFEMLALLRQHLKLLVVAPLAAGLVALGITYLIAPTFTATTTFLPPQQQQSAAASVLAQLGPLAGLAGVAGAVRTPADQYVALMQSVTVSDRVIEQFKLMQEYDVDYRMDARKALANNVRIAVGKKDGLITVDVDDKSPQRAAAMANQYVDELRRLTGTIAITEAQQRRLFFEHQLQQTKDKLIAAQQALQASGFSQGAIKAEPKAAAEGYAKLRAEVTAAEVRLQTTRGTLADDTPEVRQQQAALAALRAQLARLEQASDISGGPDYVSKYREFKYQETLFDLFAKQYELARVDESREGALIQVVDPATPPEKKSKPKRALTAVAATLAVALLLVVGLVVRQSWRTRQQRLASGALSG
ncbi:MAG TPA: Wzz/FepE/Etk N-terminal domain-containing protein [Burkholderiaceae bacterium]|nr:Wzz/FepE/Etk N-terminal domain-containing protein [Burkholderiaceae bacterium]